MENKQTVTVLQEIRYLLPLIAGLVTIIYFLASLSFKIDAIQSQQVESKTQMIQTNATVEMMRVAQTTQGSDIAVIKQILQHNSLTYKPAPQKLVSLALTPSLSNTSATLKPTPTNTPASTTNNTTIIMPPQQSQPTHTLPTPTPQPTPKPVICITSLLNVCI